MQTLEYSLWKMNVWMCLSYCAVLYGAVCDHVDIGYALQTRVVPRTVWIRLQPSIPLGPGSVKWRPSSAGKAKARFILFVNKCVHVKVKQRALTMHTISQLYWLRFSWQSTSMQTRVVPCTVWIRLQPSIPPGPGSVKWGPSSAGKAKAHIILFVNKCVHVKVKLWQPLQCILYLSSSGWGSRGKNTISRGCNVTFTFITLAWMRRGIKYIDTKSTENWHTDSNPNPNLNFNPMPNYRYAMHAIRCNVPICCILSSPMSERLT